MKHESLHVDSHLRRGLVMYISLCWVWEPFLLDCIYERQRRSFFASDNG